MGPISKCGRFYAVGGNNRKSACMRTLQVDPICVVSSNIDGKTTRFLNHPLPLCWRASREDDHARGRGGGDTQRTTGIACQQTLTSRLKDIRFPSILHPSIHVFTKSSKCLPTLPYAALLCLSPRQNRSRQTPPERKSGPEYRSTCTITKSHSERASQEEKGNTLTRLDSLPWGARVALLGLPPNQSVAATFGVRPNATRICRHPVTTYRSSFVLSPPLELLPALYVLRHRRSRLPSLVSTKYR